MGMRADILADLVEAFDGDLSDAVSEFTYYRRTLSYDPVTGSTEVASKISSRGIFDAPTTKNFPGSGGVTSDALDLVLVVIQDELAIIPKRADKIVSKKRGTFNIVDIREDSITATYTFALVRVGE